MNNSSLFADNGMKSINSVKSSDNTNFVVFTLSLMKNFSWGLTYFDQFILYVKNHILNSILIIWPLWKYESSV